MKKYVFCLWVMTLTLCAQDSEKQPLPPGPLIQKRAPDYSQWTIKVAPRPDKPKAEPVKNDAAPGKEEKPYWGEMVSITKTENIMLRRTMDAQGQTWNTWCIEDFQTTISPDEKSLMMQSRSLDPNVPASNYEDYSQTDFPGFEWVSAKSYAGIKLINGKKCILFQGKGRSDVEGKDGGDLMAYINLETRYPVALIIGNDCRTYEFQAPPQTKLQIPQILKQLLSNRRKIMGLPPVEY